MLVLVLVLDLGAWVRVLGAPSQWTEWTEWTAVVGQGGTRERARPIEHEDEHEHEDEDEDEDEDG